MANGGSPGLAERYTAAAGAPAAEAVASAAAEELQPQEAQPPKWRRPPSREGRKAIVVHLDPAGYREMRLLSLNAERPLQSLMIEAVNDLLEKYEHPRYAEGRN